jgi:hypothetical protein
MFLRQSSGIVLAVPTGSLRVLGRQAKGAYVMGQVFTIGEETLHIVGDRQCQECPD